MDEITRMQQECTGTSRVNRICPERIKPDIGELIRELNAMRDDSMSEAENDLIWQYSRLICTVVDVFTPYRLQGEVPDSEYETFLGYMEVLVKLRKEMVECLLGVNNQKTVSDVMGKVTAFQRVISSASTWSVGREYTLFEDEKLTLDVVKKLNTDWDSIMLVLDNGDFETLFMKFCQYKKDKRLFGSSCYTEEEFKKIFFEMLEGKRKFSNPINVYQVVSHTYDVVDASESPEVGLAFLTPNDPYRDSTWRVILKKEKEIPAKAK